VANLSGSAKPRWQIVSSEPLPEGLAPQAVGDSFVATSDQALAPLSVTFVGTFDDCDHMSGLVAGVLSATATRLRATYCGDGVVQAPDEACDDGNFLDGDTCTATCVAAGCGNGIIEGTEACDDGNLVNGDGCEVLSAHSLAL